MGYKFVRAPDNYPGKIYKCGHRVLEHRLVWWQNTGNIADDLEVHHKNEIKDDNRFENLELMSSKDHHVLHNHKGRPDTQFTCPVCKTVFTRTARYVESKKKNNVTKFYCSKRCSVSMTSGNSRGAVAQLG